MSSDAFRWQTFFQRSTDPLFLLNRQGYLLFVNRAWEQLTGVSAAEVTGRANKLSCRRSKPSLPHHEWRKILAHVHTPPAEVFDGVPGRQRRLIPAREGKPPAWWDVDFFPLRDGDGLRGVLGRITPVHGGERETASGRGPLPEVVVAIRQRQVGRLAHVYLSMRLPALRRVSEQVRLASELHTPVLLVGGSGTGKETLARTIHHRGPGRERSFAALDCERLPPSAVGVLLFDEAGAAARAPLATVYLREPAALARELQARLCEWLTEGRDAGWPPRVMAGCRRDPVEDVREGHVLEEFYHALSIFRIDVPTLRERRDDLPHLVEQMLRRLNAGGGKAVSGLSADSWELALAYDWPGNLRELYSVLRSARERAAGDLIDAAELPAYLRLEDLPGPRPEPPLSFDQLTGQVQRHLIGLALRRARGNKTRAAEILEISRPRLHRLMEDLKIADPEDT